MRKTPFGGLLILWWRQYFGSIIPWKTWIVKGWKGKKKKIYVVYFLIYVYVCDFILRLIFDQLIAYLMLNYLILLVYLLMCYIFWLWSIGSRLFVLYMSSLVEYLMVLIELDRWIRDCLLDYLILLFHLLLHYIFWLWNIRNRLFLLCNWFLHLLMEILLIHCLVILVLDQ